MNPGELCICGHTYEVHFGHDCSKVDCRCKEFAVLDAALDIFEALKAVTRCLAMVDSSEADVEALNMAEAAFRKAKGQ